MLQLEPPTYIGLARLSVRVVGWIEDQRLLLTIPYIERGRRLSLNAGENVVLRGFTGRSAFAFACSVLKSTSGPESYMNLSFPEEITGIEVRTSPRFRTEIPARATGAAGQPVDVTIVDLGSTGALLSCAAPLGEPGASITLEFDVVVHDVPVSLTLKAIVRSTGQDGGSGLHRHGVSFVGPAAMERLALAALVWFNMHENPKLRV